MASQYEIEHNITPPNKPPTRRPDMSTFTSLLDQLSTHGPTTQTPTFSSLPHHNPHATPTPVSVSALYRLVQDQFATLASDAPTAENRRLLEGLIAELESSVVEPPSEVWGVGQEFLDGLERVERKGLKKEDKCPICAEAHLDDAYCLVVELPCHKSHRFDLECVGPWLQSKGTCPMCRVDFTKKKEVIVEDSEDDDDPAGMYA